MLVRDVATHRPLAWGCARRTSHMATCTPAAPVKGGHGTHLTMEVVGLGKVRDAPGLTERGRAGVGTDAR